MMTVSHLEGLRLDEILDAVEGAEELLDLAEDPLDAVEGAEDALDAVEGADDTLDAVEGAVDTLDAVEGAVDTLDAVEGALDAVEGAGDEILDAVEGADDTLDAVEGAVDTLDAVEGAVDTLDAVEGSEDEILDAVEAVDLPAAGGLRYHWRSGKSLLDTFPPARGAGSLGPPAGRQTVCWSRALGPKRRREEQGSGDEVHVEGGGQEVVGTHEHRQLLLPAALQDATSDQSKTVPRSGRRTWTWRRSVPRGA